MLVSCPRCLTKYRLAEEGLPEQPELDLLCSRCGFEFVFTRPRGRVEGLAPEPPEVEREPAGPVEEECELLEKVPENEAVGRPVKGETAAAPRGTSCFLVLACLLVLILALAAGYMLWSGRVGELAGKLHLVDLDSSIRQLPSGRRQLILQGSVVNASRRPVEILELEGVLLDKSGRRLARIEFSPDSAARDSANTGKRCLAVPPGGRRKFRLLAPDCPPAARKYLVEISSLAVGSGPNGSGKRE